MLRAIWFAIQIGILLYAALWVSQRPGTFDIDWLGYQIHGQIGVFLAGVLLLVLMVLALHKIFLALIGLRRRYKDYRAHQRHEKGLKALTLGLSAVAAGDAKVANYQSFRAQKYLSADQGLVVLLDAQAARLNNDEKRAEAAFDKLLEHKETAFLGLRGKLLNAIQDQRYDEAGDMARKALGMYPKQSWLLRMVYDLEVGNKNWPEAEAVLKKAQKAKAMTASEVNGNLAALQMLYADETSIAAKKEAHYKKALKIDAGFVPAALALAKDYIARGDKRKARALISKIWVLNPHPAFVPLWEELATYKTVDKPAKKLKYYEKLVTLNPESYESLLAVARYALDFGLIAEAAQYLEQAKALDNTVRLYEMRAELEEAMNERDAALDTLEDGAAAKADKVWICRETGRVYEGWQPIAAPHGGFNTIVWDYPQLFAGHGLTHAAANQEILSLAPRAV